MVVLKKSISEPIESSYCNNSLKEAGVMKISV